MSFIQMRGVTKIYNKGKLNEVNALRGIDLDIEKGESVAVMGVSGSGKSTLLHIMGTLDLPSAGKYTVDGIEVFAMTPAQKALFRNEKIGFALQDFGLLENETVEYNIMLPLYFAKGKAKDMKNRAKTIAQNLGIGELVKRKIKQLSGGQKQRVALARALVNDPQLILADEPTSALDSTTATEIVDLLLSLQKQGKTVIMVTHDAAIAKKFDRVLFISDGKITDVSTQE